MENTPLPHSMLLVCSSRSQQLRHNIVWGVGGLKGQAWREESDDSDEIGGKKGECVNNFVADCSLLTKLCENLVPDERPQGFRGKATENSDGNSNSESEGNACKPGNDSVMLSKSLGSRYQ